MKRFIGTALALGLVGAASAQTPPANPAAPGAPGAPPVRRGFTVARSTGLDLAIEAAKAALASCSDFHAGAVILDHDGLPKLYYIPDGVSGSHGLMGFRKANTALLAGGPSESIVAKSAADKTIADKIAASPRDYTTNAGGLLITVNGEVIGAIGVSGAEPSAKDEACAEDGLKAIQSRLK